MSLTQSFLSVNISILQKIKWFKIPQKDLAEQEIELEI